MLNNPDGNIKCPQIDYGERKKDVKESGLNYWGTYKWGNFEGSSETSPCCNLKTNVRLSF